MSKQRARWIQFKLMGISVSGKTKLWQVLSLGPLEVMLGEVRWLGRWRRYSFFPNQGLPLVFEKDCLRDLADFCESETKAQRARLLVTEESKP